MAASGALKKKAISSSLNHIMQNIKVVVRVRPLSRSEEEQNVKSIIKCHTHKEILMKDKKYSYDRVFKPTAPQIELYLNVVAPLIKDVIHGYNCTVFAYGQTGTGKTYTMTGDKCSVIKNWKEDQDAGIIPRAAYHLFDELQRMRITNYTVKVSYIELYNEEIRDLLSKEEGALQLFTDSKGLVINGLTEETVYSSVDVCKHLQRGIIKRQVAPTLMNHQSSRSHTVFTMYLTTTESNFKGEDILKFGKINLVDLAGSENIAKAGCRDLRAQELANINKSLLTLGRVIHSLADKNPKHIPYRDSKLTRILQDSLGGNTKTVIIATVSPAPSSYEETANTLEYAMRARDIKNTPVANEHTSKNQLIDDLVKDIEWLQKDLDAARQGTGFYVDRDNYLRLMDAVWAVTGEYLTPDEIADRKVERISKLEEVLHHRVQQFDKAVEECKEHCDELNRIKTEIKEKDINLEKEKYLVGWYEQHSNTNQQELQNLIETTQTLNNEKEILLGKLEHLFHANETTVQIARKSAATVLSLVDKNIGDKDKMLRNIRDAGSTVKGTAEECRSTSSSVISSVKSAANKVVEISQTEDSAHAKLQRCMCKPLTTIRKRFAVIDKSQNETIAGIPTLVEQQRQRNEAILEASVNYLERNNKKMLGYNNRFTSHLETFENETQARIQQDEEQIKVLTERIKKAKANLQELQECKNEISRVVTEDDNELKKTVAELSNMAKQSVQSLEESVGFVYNNHKNNKQSLNESKEALDKLDCGLKTFCDELDADHRKISQNVSNVVNDNILKPLTEVDDFLNLKIGDIINETDSIVAVTNSFDATYRQFTDHLKETVTRQILEKAEPPRHVGDTPVRKELKVPSVEAVAPRQVLLERFEINLPRTVEDDENAGIWMSEDVKINGEQ